MSRAPYPSPDQELLTALAEFDVLEWQYMGCFDGPTAIADDKEQEAASDLILERQLPILEKICNTRAKTMDGILARVRTILFEDQDLDPVEMAAAGSYNERLLGALLRDLAEQAGTGRAPT
jgi:hypothetical protein